MPFLKTTASTLLVGAVCLGGVGSVQATPLFGSSFGGPDGTFLYDVNPASGLASDPRPVGIDRLVGIALVPGGTLYGLSNQADLHNPNALFTIDPATGASQLVGATGLADVTEGDLAFDPTTGELYGIYNLDGGRRELFTIDTGTGLATTMTVSLSGDPSGMAFDDAGTLYVLDTSLQKLLTVDKMTGATLTVTPLSMALGSTAGMDVDPATGVFYVADGESGGTDKLYTLNTTTGVLTEIGPTGLASGLAGLAFVPEPATILLLAVGGVMVLRRRRV